MPAIDRKYGPIFRKKDVIAIVQVSKEHASLSIDEAVGVLQESGYSFHFEDNEPVVVFRAKDQLLPDVLINYHDLCMKAGSPKVHLDLILESEKKVEQWQGEHGWVVPTSSHLGEHY